MKYESKNFLSEEKEKILLVAHQLQFESIRLLSLPLIKCKTYYLY